MSSAAPTAQVNQPQPKSAFDPPSVAEKIKAALPDAVVSAASNGIIVQGSKIPDVVRFLRDSPDLEYNYLSQITSVDWPDRFEVVYHVASISRGGSPLPLKVNLNDKANPTVPTITSIFAGADCQEREVWDLMGIKFAGHPNLRRIFLWEGFEGFPLRKDYKEAYYEQDKKPFESRWDQGHHIIAEDRNPWHDNVVYPESFDPTKYTPEREIQRAVASLTEARSGTAVRTQPIVINMGPQHPSTHGVFRMRVTLDGETVVALEPVFGYMHRNHEKIGERNTFIMNIPYCDRLDYLSGMSMGYGYVLTVEKMMGIKPPERAEYIRVIMNELTRIQSHLFGGIGQLYSDLGAFHTPMLYGLEERELILDLFEAAAGSRMMVNYMRFGGVWRDLPEGFLEATKVIVEERIPKIADELESYLIHNELFDERAKGIGVLPADVAINYSASGPFLRASGVKYDLRRADPYSIYDRFDFDIPVGTNGDVYDRLLVRIRELRESGKILRQALKDIPTGEIQTGKKNYSVRVPKGDFYGHIEAPRGEFGWYVVSDGTPNPYRYHVRAGDFINVNTLEQQAVGQKVGDLVAMLGAIDIIMGSVDR